MTSIYVLGAGTPTPTKDRFGSAFAIKIGEDQIMLDCGPAATHKLVKAGLWPTDINHIFFTHHHFDHDIDYPCFLLCRWDQSIGVEDTLKVFGPTLTEKITNGILNEKDGLFAHDWIARINHPLSQKVYENRGGTLPRTPPHVIAKDVGPGPVYTKSDWSVTAAPAIHVQPYLDSLAYRFETPEGSIVFTGDTQPCESVTKLAKNADMMLCMCWDEQSEMDENGEHLGQCGTSGAAKMAEEAGVKKLVLVHIGPNLSNSESQIRGREEISNIYSGEILFADELMKIDL
jgi:ribonuclease BN (tRNA processing enzyme)|tara:strand:+ start:354 stop:1217 length:864 start_codon:yes stop_codon:yes gene_type:complete